MIKFKNLEFSLGDFGGVGATHTFENGITISVKASLFAYSLPRENLSSANKYSSFEVAIWDEAGKWITKNFIPNNHEYDVIGWQNRDEINDIMKAIQSK